jgi:hypothetical protein
VTGAEVFSWRGEPIRDIVAWAAARGERMVSYHAERVVPDLVSGGLTKEEYDGAMPESFWNGLAMTHGWTYTERA